MLALSAEVCDHLTIDHLTVHVTGIISQQLLPTGRVCVGSGLPALYLVTEAVQTGVLSEVVHRCDAPVLCLDVPGKQI